MNEVAAWRAFRNRRFLHFALGQYKPHTIRDQQTRGQSKESRVTESLRTTAYRGKVRIFFNNTPLEDLLNLPRVA